MNKIEIKSNRDGGWQGNGFGTIPNSYTAAVNGEKKGILVKRDDRWSYYELCETVIDGVLFPTPRYPAFTARTFRESKAAVRNLLTTTD